MKKLRARKSLPRQTAELDDHRNPNQGVARRLARPFERGPLAA